MTWEVEVSDEFSEWFGELDEWDKARVAAMVGLLEEAGPRLEFPYSSGIRGSRHSRMRELRVQAKGDPLRVLYAFDPRRIPILLIGGNKTGNDRWYEQYVPMADRLYDDHIETLRREGLIDGKD